MKISWLVGCSSTWLSKVQNPNISNCNLQNSVWLIWISELLEMEKMSVTMELKQKLLWASMLIVSPCRISILLSSETYLKNIYNFFQKFESLVWIKTILVFFQSCFQVLCLFVLSFCRMNKTEPWKGWLHLISKTSNK